MNLMDLLAPGVFVEHVNCILTFDWTVISPSCNYTGAQQSRLFFIVIWLHAFLPRLRSIITGRLLPVFVLFEFLLVVWSTKRLQVSVSRGNHVSVVCSFQLSTLCLWVTFESLSSDVQSQNLFLSFFSQFTTNGILPCFLCVSLYVWLGHILG